MSTTPPSPKADQNNQTNSTDESKEQQQIAPQTGELDAEQLDRVSGGATGSNAGTTIGSGSAAANKALLEAMGLGGVP